MERLDGEGAALKLPEEALHLDPPVAEDQEDVVFLRLFKEAQERHRPLVFAVDLEP